MRKLILTVVSIIIVLLSILCVTKGIKGPFEIYSIAQISQRNEDTTSKLNELTSLKSTNYRREEADLKKTVAEYEEVSQRYETISAYKTDVEKVAALSGQEYDIEFLQVKLGQYATNSKVDLSIELSKNDEKDGYILCDFKFQVVGSYSGIINFIEDVSADEQLKFIPENLKMFSEYREVSTIYENSVAATTTTNTTRTNTSSQATNNNLPATNKVNKKQKRLMLVGEFYKSNIPVKKDSLLKVENSNETNNQ